MLPNAPSWKDLSEAEAVENEAKVATATSVIAEIIILIFFHKNAPFHISITMQANCPQNGLFIAERQGEVKSNVVCIVGASRLISTCTVTRGQAAQLLRPYAA